MSKTVKYLDLGITISLIFIATTFPLPYKISNLGIVALIIFWVAKRMVSRELPSFSFLNKLDKLMFYSYLAFFLLNITALLYTDDINNGIKNIESKLSFLIFPLILYDLKLEFKKIIQLFKWYILSMAVCTVVLLFQSIAHYVENGSLLTYHDFTRSLDFHAVFYSYYIFLSVLFCVFLYLKNQLSSKEKGIAIVALILSFIGLIMSASKNVMVVSTLFLFAGILIKGLKSKVGFKEIAGLALLLIIAVVSISQVPALKNRIAELTQLNGIENIEKLKKREKLEEVDARKFNGTSLRVAFWYVGIRKIIEEDHIAFGFSPGDRRAVMNAEYFENGINPWYENYNIHNQFIQVLVELGLIGFLVYLLIHILHFKIAIKQKNYLQLAFLIGLVIFQMTESLIERNKGIVFFMFFLILVQQFNPKLDENRNTGD